MIPENSCFLQDKFWGNNHSGKVRVTGPTAFLLTKRIKKNAGK